jgi:hypothetical protein
LGSVERSVDLKAPARYKDVFAKTRILRSFAVGGISDRKQEIDRRRHRRQKLAKLKVKLKKANASEKALIVQKIRQLTPGAETIIANWGLSESHR